MDQCKIVKVSILGIIFLTTFPAFGAETIEIDRVFSFSRHDRLYDFISNWTLIRHRYTVNTDAVVLDNNDG